MNYNNKVNVLIIGAFGKDNEHIFKLKRMVVQITEEIKKTKKSSKQLVNVKLPVLEPGAIIPDSIIKKIYQADMIIVDITDIKRKKEININTTFEYGIAIGYSSFARELNKYKIDMPGFELVKQFRKVIITVMDKKSQINIDEKFSDVKGIIYGNYDKERFDDLTVKTIKRKINFLLKEKNKENI